MMPVMHENAVIMKQNKKTQSAPTGNAHCFPLCIR